MPLRKYFALTLIVFLSGQVTAQNNTDLPRNYAISDVYFIDYLGFIRPNFAVVPCNGGVFAPNWHSWYFKTSDTILSVEPSYLDTSLVLTRTSRNLFEIVKVSLNSERKKITPLVLTKGFIFYSVPSNFIRDLTFYVVGYNNKFNICRLYNHKVDTIFTCDSMISQLEVADKSTLIFSHGNSLIVYPLDKKPVVLFDADKYRIHGFASDNKGSLYVSIDPGIIKIEKFSQLSLQPTESVRGKLRYFDEKLYILNAGDRVLSVIPTGSLSFTQLSAPAETEPKKPLNAESKDLLTNISVIRMVNAGLEEDMIISLINRSPVNFNTSIDSMIYLSDRKVSSRVIMAMRDAMKRPGNPPAPAAQAKTQTEGNKLIGNQPAQNTSSQTATATTIKRFYIIIGSYPTEQQANEAVENLKKKGYKDAEVAGLSSSGTYRIASKGYATNEEAARDLADVRSKLNSSAWIFEKK